MSTKYFQILDWEIEVIVLLLLKNNKCNWDTDFIANNNSSMSYPSQSLNMIVTYFLSVWWGLMILAFPITPWLQGMRYLKDKYC